MRDNPFCVHECFSVFHTSLGIRLSGIRLSGISLSVIRYPRFLPCRSKAKICDNIAWVCLFTFCLKQR